MEDLSTVYDAILNQYVEWARERADVRSVLVVGSRARSDHPADQWADLDIITFTRTPGLYVHDSGWIHRFGEVWALTRSRTAGGDAEWLVCYAGGVDVDYVFNDSRQVARQARLMALLDRFSIARRVLPGQFLARVEQGRGMAAATFARGARIVLDKDGQLNQMAGLLGSPFPYRPPGAEEFAARVSNFWLLVERIAKKIGRGELAVALSWMNGLYWSALLPMTEWHAHAVLDPQVDTWHAGRFLEEWADPRVLDALPHIFATYDRQAAVDALLALMALFRWLGEETAGRLGYAYPAQVDQRMSEYVRQILGAENE